MMLLIALAMAAFALFSYFSSSEVNPITGEKQYVSLSKEQEIQLGFASAPEMEAQFGGLHPDAEAQALVDDVCAQIISNSAAANSDYQFECNLLADSQTINAFALPGGPVYITAALLSRLETVGQLAGVLGHEIGHVVARHSSQQIAKQQLTQGLTGAAVMAAYDPENPRGSQYAAQMAILVGQVVNMKYGRDDELESDRLGVQFISEAGYDPRALIGVMEILAESSEGPRQPEFFSTHPNPDNRIGEIQAAIEAEFPNGVPAGLIP